MILSRSIKALITGVDIVAEWVKPLPATFHMTTGLSPLYF